MCRRVVIYTHTSSPVHCRTIRKCLVTLDTIQVRAYIRCTYPDTGDNWQVICSADEYWRRPASIQLKHEDTGTYLSVPGQTYGRPIAGQMEVGPAGVRHIRGACAGGRHEFNRRHDTVEDGRGCVCATD